MIRVVLDTNILFSAVFKSTGTQAKLIRLIVENKIIPCVSPRRWRNTMKSWADPSFSTVLPKFNTC